MIHRQSKVPIKHSTECSMDEYKKNVYPFAKKSPAKYNNKYPINC